MSAVANLAKGQLEGALATEELDADALDLVRRGRGSDRREGSLLQSIGVHGSAEVTNVLPAA